MGRIPVMVLIAMMGALVLGTALSACAPPDPPGAAPGPEREVTAPLQYDEPVDLGIPGALETTARDVAYYPACGTEVLTVDGTSWYPFTPANLAVFPSPPVAAGDGGLGGGTMRVVLPTVVAPGPGDDVGTLTVYAGGFAYWASDSGGLETWLTDRELEYLWIC